MNERRRALSGAVVKEPVDYSLQYLTITSLEDSNTIYWKSSSYRYNNYTISVSTDDGETWTDKTNNSSSGATLATLSKGQKMLIKGVNLTYGTSSYYSYFSFSKNVKVSGNIMSMCYGDDFVGKLTVTSSAFRYLFTGQSKLVSVKNLVLPALTVGANAYEAMS